MRAIQAAVAPSIATLRAKLADPAADPAATTPSGSGAAGPRAQAARSARCTGSSTVQHRQRAVHPRGRCARGVRGAARRDAQPGRARGRQPLQGDARRPLPQAADQPRRATLVAGAVRRRRPRRAAGDLDARRPSLDHQGDPLPQPVGPENGPFCYCLGSNHVRIGWLEGAARRANDRIDLSSCTPERRRLFHALPKRLRRKAKFGNDLSRTIPRSRGSWRARRRFTSADGDLILFDDRGIHRGGLVEAGERTCCRSGSAEPARAEPRVAPGMVAARAGLDARPWTARERPPPATGCGRATRRPPGGGLQPDPAQPAVASARQPRRRARGLRAGQRPAPAGSTACAAAPAARSRLRGCTSTARSAAASRC